MKTVLTLIILCMSSPTFAEVPFENKVYTPEVVIDRENTGEKGAVQLLWQKNPRATRYEVEVSNGKLVYSQVGERHFHHVMLYFDRDYQWRVREVSAQKTTEFSPWMPLRVVRGDQPRMANSESDQEPVDAGENEREPVSVKEAKADVDEYMLDTGDE